MVTNGKSRASKEDIGQFVSIIIDYLSKVLQSTEGKNFEKKNLEQGLNFGIDLVFKNLNVRRKRRNQSNINLITFRQEIVEAITDANLTILSCADASDIPFNGCSPAGRRRRKKKFIEKDTGE